MSAPQSRTARIAELNDRFRRTVVSPLGVVVLTYGVAQQPPEVVREILNLVRDHDPFDAGNPHVEHEYGKLWNTGAGKVYWRIECFEDASCDFASEDPADPERSFRVLTIMLAEED